MALDLGTMLRNAADAERGKQFNQSPQLSLGELILKLEAMPPDAAVSIDRERVVGHLTSWRGIYSELALTPSLGRHQKPHTVSTLLAHLRDAIGKTFTGYKGGDYVMGRQTPVWVSEYGDATDDAVVDVQRIGERVEIVTQNMEPYDL